MKKINFLMLAAFSMAIAACSPNNNEGNGGSEELIGKWFIGMNPVWPEILDSMYIGQPGAYVFASNGKFTQQSEYEKSDGSYSYSNGVINMTTEHVWFYDSYEEKYVEVPDSEVSKIPNIFSPEFIYDGNIMIQKFELETDTMGDPLPAKEDPFMLLFKEGTNVPSDSKLIQGFWNWKAFGREGTTRLAVKFEGNNFTFWNPSWHEYFKGTFEYKNGMVKFNVDENSFRIRRWWELPLEFNMEATENLDEYWQVPVEIEGDRMIPTFGWVFVMPFVVDKNQAYSSFANLSCQFDKQ